MLVLKVIGIAVCVLISVIDARTYIIPDTLLFILALLFFIPDILLDRSHIPMRLIQGSALFLLFAVIYRLTGGLGFGDVKMIGILGYGFGFLPTVMICLCASMSALLFCTTTYVISKDKNKDNLLLQKIPFAPFLTIGTAAIFFVQEFVL